MVNAMKEFTVTLPENAWQFIGNVLSEKPFREVAELMASISKQINDQAAAAAELPEDGK